MLQLSRHWWHRPGRKTGSRGIGIRDPNEPPAIQATDGSNTPKKLAHVRHDVCRFDIIVVLYVLLIISNYMHAC